MTLAKIDAQKALNCIDGLAVLLIVWMTYTASTIVFSPDKTFYLVFNALLIATIYDMGKVHQNIKINLEAVKAEQAQAELA